MLIREARLAYREFYTYPEIKFIATFILAQTKKLHYPVFQ